MASGVDGARNCANRLPDFTVGGAATVQTGSTGSG
jgi:hypothetical protein